MVVVVLLAWACFNASLALLLIPLARRIGFLPVFDDGVLDAPDGLGERIGVWRHESALGVGHQLAE